MKKTMFTLIALLVMAVRFAYAQNYEVVYKADLNTDLIAYTIFSTPNSSEHMDLDTLKKDLRQSEFYFTVNMSEDRQKSHFEHEKSKLQLHFSDSLVNVKNIIRMANPTLYTDCLKDEYYVEINVIDTICLVKCKFSGLGKEVFYPAEGTKNILGHECKKVTSNKGMTLWYAVDIPFETKVYQDVPGLVLGMESKGRGVMTAVSIMPHNREIQMPDGPCMEIDAEVIKQMNSNKSYSYEKDSFNINRAAGNGSSVCKCTELRSGVRIKI